MSTFDTVPHTKQNALVETLLRLADDRLIHGHRLSEWTGHGPELEEDLALANVALDMIGHAASLYSYAAEIEGKEDEDYYAYFRDCFGISTRRRSPGAASNWPSSSSGWGRASPTPTTPRRR